MACEELLEEQDVPRQQAWVCEQNNRKHKSRILDCQGL